MSVALDVDETMYTTHSDMYVVLDGVPILLMVTNPTAEITANITS